MTIYPYQKSNSQEGQNNLEYDLDFEKKRVEIGTEEIKKELTERWRRENQNSPVFPDKVRSVSPQLIDFLLSFQNTIFYNNLAKKYSLSQDQRDMVPQIVWHVCLNNSWENVENVVQKNLNVANPTEIVNLLNSNILFKAREIASSQGTIPQKHSTEPTSADKKVSITLQEAMKAYPELGEQLITTQRIKLKSFPDPIRPSVKNWISDYTFNFGYDQHSTVIRNNYLFQTENTRPLSNSDRQRLSYVLKAFDEKNPIAINTTIKQIIFPEMEPVSQPSTTPHGNQEKPYQWTKNNDQETVKNIQPRQNPDGRFRIEDFKRSELEDLKKQELPSSHRANHQTENTELKFSASQKLPYEKAREETRQDLPLKKMEESQPIQRASQAMQKTQPRPVEPRPTAPQAIPPQPIRISSGFHQDEKESEEEISERPLPRNVVNLKE
jgi:hypothetical protein